MMIFLVGVIAIALVVVGRWGRRSVSGLVPPMLEPQEKEKRERVMRRGAVVMQLVGVVLLCFSLSGIVVLLLRP